VFTHLGYFLADKSTAEPAAMAEFIEGAGGSYAALAALVVDHYFLSVIPDTGTVMDFMEVYYLDNVFDFLRHTAPNLFDHNTIGWPARNYRGLRFKTASNSTRYFPTIFWIFRLLLFSSHLFLQIFGDLSLSSGPQTEGRKLVFISESRLLRGATVKTAQSSFCLGIFHSRSSNCRIF
jgi:hypothetical protein